MLGHHAKAFACQLPHTQRVTHGGGDTGKWMGMADLLVPPLGLQAPDRQMENGDCGWVAAGAEVAVGSRGRWY